MSSNPGSQQSQHGGEEEYEGNPFEYGDLQRQDHRQVPVPEWDDFEPGVEAPPRERPRTYAALETAADHRAKTLHDRPPIWDGEHAEKQLKPYLKELSMSLKITDTPKKRQGFAVMGYATGKLKQIIDALEEDEIADESGGILVMSTVQ